MFYQQIMFENKIHKGVDYVATQFKKWKNK